MPARKLKPVKANDRSYAGRVLAAFDAIAASRCACGECRELDRAYPSEGFQLRLISPQLGGEPGCDPARPSHPDAPAVAPAGEAQPEGRLKSRPALAASTDRSNPVMNDTTTLEKPRRGKKTEAAAPPPASIVPTAIETVRLGDLRRAPENVRHTKADEGVDELADDIAAHGLLQSLIGYRDGDVVQVVGGGRRYQALRELANRWLITLDFPIPVLIRDRDEAVELSLSENLARRDMNPADEFVAFATLMAAGTRSPADLAKRFGFSERYVKQRLKLAALAPEILDTLRAGDMTLEAALAYGRAADQNVQRKVFAAQAKRSYDKHGAERVRYAIGAEKKTTDWPLYRFIGAEAYERRGGDYQDASLFGDDTDTARHISDGALVVQIAQEHLDFQMLRRLPEMADELELDRDQVVGFVIMPDMEIGQYTMAYHGIDKHACEGFVWVGNDYGPDRVERMLKTIRNNHIPVRLPVGINAAGELVRFTKGFFVPKEQKNAIDPPAQAYQPAPKLTPEEIEAERRKRAISEIAYRRGIGKFAGTPLEGRAFYPEDKNWISAFEEPSRQDQRGKGKMVTIQIYVTHEEAETEMVAAEQVYEDQLREAAERREREQRERAEREAAEEKREAELRAMEPPAVVVISGEAWARDEDGAYETIDKIEDGYVGSWTELLDMFGAREVDHAYVKRGHFDAAMAAAAMAAELDADEAPAGEATA